MSEIIVKKIGYGKHTEPKFSKRGARCYINARKKVLEHHSGLHPSEKELPRMVFRYKNTPGCDYIWIET
jgi:hypothetical protein